MASQRRLAELKSVGLQTQFFSTAKVFLTSAFNTPFLRFVLVGRDYKITLFYEIDPLIGAFQS